MNTQSIPLDVAEQAMHWLLELQEAPVNETTLAAWQRWRHAHPSHEQAWQRAEAFAQRMADVRASAHPSLANVVLQNPLSRRRAIKQLSLLLVAGAAAWQARDLALVQDWRADFSTRIGEQRPVRLADNTHIQLNTDSAIEVRFDLEVRRIQLLRGEILITQDTLNANRPLHVETIAGRLESGAHELAVRQLGSIIEVSAYQGPVSVSPANRSGAALSLAAGEQGVFNSVGLLTRHPLNSAQPAWSQGMLVAQGQPLAQFLEELGRYRPGRLSCDPSLAELKVSGTFPLADTDRVITAVAHTLQIEVQHFTRYWVTLKPRIA